MHEGVLGQDFEHWVALSDAYERQISRLCLDGAASLNIELRRLSHDLRAMDSGFLPLCLHDSTD